MNPNSEHIRFSQLNQKHLKREIFPINLKCAFICKYNHETCLNVKNLCFQICLFYFSECKCRLSYVQRIILIGITDTISFCLTLCNLLHFPLQRDETFFLLKCLQLGFLEMKSCCFNSEFFRLPRVKTHIKYVDSVYLVGSWQIRACCVILSGCGKKAR